MDEAKSERARKLEERNLEAAKAEAAYGKAVWLHDFQAARTALDTVVADTARADEKLAGWHNLWIGAALDQEGDRVQSQLYFARARGQLGLNLIVSTGRMSVTQDGTPPAKRIVANLLMLTNLGRESFLKQVRGLTTQLAPLDGGTPSQMEEAVRLLGETLGFSATRPDNQDDTGPDVLWRDADEGTAVGLELKTDKADGSTYSKAEVSQSLDHLNWINDNLGGAVSLGCILVGPAVGHHHQANPSRELFYTTGKTLVDLRDKILAIARDAYERVPQERSTFIEGATKDLGLRDLLASLAVKPLKAA